MTWRFPAIPELVTPDVAARIKWLRCSLGASWRMVAGDIYDHLGLSDEWAPPTNQLAGRELCEAAADVLGEEID